MSMESGSCQYCGMSGAHSPECPTQFKALEDDITQETTSSSTEHSSEGKKQPIEPKKKKRSLKSYLYELVEGMEPREDLASRETVNIKGKELRAGDILYTFQQKTKEPIPWVIRYWDKRGVVLRHRDADSMPLKERMRGGADEWSCNWKDLDTLSIEPELQE